MNDDGRSDEYAELVEDGMDVREVVGVLCDARDDSRVRRETALDAAEEAGIDRGVASRFLNEYISTTEIVELDDGWVQTRRHFDETFDGE